MIAARLTVAMFARTRTSQLGRPAEGGTCTGFREHLYFEDWAVFLPFLGTSEHARARASAVRSGHAGNPCRERGCLAAQRRRSTPRVPRCTHPRQRPAGYTLANSPLLNGAPHLKIVKTNGLTRRYVSGLPVAQLDWPRTLYDPLPCRQSPVV